MISEKGKENIAINEQVITVSKGKNTSKMAFRLTTKPKTNQTLYFFLINENFLAGEISNVSIEFCKPLN